MKISMAFVAFIGLLVELAAAQGTAATCCADVAPVLQGSRALGIDLLDVGGNGRTFNDNIVDARAIQANFIALHLAWTQIETSPSSYSDPSSAMAGLSGVATANSWKFSLTIRPIDLTGKTVPSDLASTRFNSLTLINRFFRLIDYVFTVIPPAQIHSLQIGNEIDGYNTANEPSTFWSDYGFFLSNCSDYVHRTFPGVQVGFTGTFHGMTSGSLRDLGVWRSLAGAVDVIGITYYPQDSSFAVRDPPTVAADFDAIVAEFSGTTILNSKKIFLQEVGYQTSSVCNSNERKQAEFFCNVFQSWDRHINRIQSINIVRLVDYSNTYATTSAGPYGISSPAFIAYLETLGVRSYGGTEKAALQMLKNLTSARLWNGVVGGSFPTGAVACGGGTGTFAPSAATPRPTTGLVPGLATSVASKRQMLVLLLEVIAVSCLLL